MMKKKHFYATIIFLTFLAVGAQSALGVINVPSQTTVSGTTIATWDSSNQIYTLTADVSEGLVITVDNLTLDGAGHTVTPSWPDAGVDLYKRSVVTIKNLKVTGGGSGISLRLSNGCTVTNNTVSTCDYGIWLAGSSNNTVTNNTISSSGESGISLSEGDNNTVSGNIVSNCVNGISISSNSASNIISDNTVTDCSDTGNNGIYVGNSNSNTVTGNNCSSNYWGIHLLSSDSTGLNGNIVTSNAGGIWLEMSSDYNTLTGNTVTNNGASGIYLSIQSNNNTFTGNTSSSNRDGFFLNASGDNTLEYNTASDNQWGIRLWDSDDNVMTNNTVSGNTEYGIWLDPSNNNQIYNNNFIDNATQAGADSDSTNNLFNLAPPTGGNFWNDWCPPDHPDGDDDGFVDESYVISTTLDVKDEFPWVAQDGWSNQPPVADAGPDQEVECACQEGGTKVTLDGTGSTGAQTYKWTGNFSESPASGPTPTVTLIGCQLEYEITLVINDGEPDSDTDTVTITVEDATPPNITCPGDIQIEVQGLDGVPIDDDEIQTFLGGAAADDNCDPALVITNDAPTVFPPGDTIVIFTTTDASGNTATCQSTVTVVEAAESPEPAEAIEPIIAVLDVLEGMDVPEDAEKEMDKAVKDLNKAIDEFNNNRIDKALNKIAKAVKQLMKAREKGADTQGVIDIDELVALVQGITDDAIAAVEPDNLHAVKAQEHYNKALGNLADGKYDAAIKKFKNAYKEAMKALGE